MFDFLFDYMDMETIIGLIAIFIFILSVLPYFLFIGLSANVSQMKKELKKTNELLSDLVQYNLHKQFQEQHNNSEESNTVYSQDNTNGF